MKCNATSSDSHDGITFAVEMHMPWQVTGVENGMKTKINFIVFRMRTANQWTIGQRLFTVYEQMCHTLKCSSAKHFVFVAWRAIAILNRRLAIETVLGVFDVVDCYVMNWESRRQCEMPISKYQGISDLTSYAPYAKWRSFTRTRTEDHFTDSEIHPAAATTYWNSLNCMLQLDDWLQWVTTLSKMDLFYFHQISVNENIKHSFIWSIELSFDCNCVHSDFIQS